MIAGVRATRVRVLLVSGLLAIVSTMGLSAQPAPQARKDAELEKAQQVESYGKRPLNFRANMGQTDQSLNSISPAYSRVRYGAASRDTDLLYYGNERQLEYDVPLAPKADPSQIRLQFSGVMKFNLDAERDLTVFAQDGDFAFRRSRPYQENDVRRDWLAGHFTFGKRHPVNFSLSGYAPPNPLVIDPVPINCSYHGVCGSDAALAIWVD